MNPAFSCNGTSQFQETSNDNPCSTAFMDIKNFDEDIINLIRQVQRHTKCSETYCLRKQTNDKNSMKCRFGFPKKLQLKTSIVFDENGEPTLETKRNDPVINSHNIDQLTSWRANCDMQLIVSKEKVVNYTAKYATKAETRSQTLKDIFSEILKDPNSNILKYVQKEISGSIADRDFFAQETMTLLQ